MEKIKITKEQQVKVLSDKDTSAKSEEIVLSGVSRYKSKRQMEEVSRGSNHRTFKENEGGYRMKIYNHPIHYFDEDAKSYRRYNNQLVKTKRIEGETSFSGYENAAGDFRVRFAEQISDGVIFTVNKGKYSVSFLPHDRAMSQAEMVYNENGQKLIFKEYSRGIDLEYTLSEGGFKENILVHDRTSESVIKFILQTKNLTMELEAGGQVLTFKSEDDNNTVFRIPAPSMSDAKGVGSEEVCYDITEKSKDTYELQVVADSAWLNEPSRTYPVSIDPTIINYAKNYIDSYELRNDSRALTRNTYNITTQYYGDNRYFSKVWIQFFLDDVIPENAVIRSAILHMRKTDRYSSGTNVSDLVVRQVKNDLSEEGSFVGKLCDNSIYTDIIGTEIKESYESYTIDVTDTIRNTDYRTKGILFEVADSDSDEFTFIIFSAYVDPIKYRPYLDVDYYIPEEFSGGEKYTTTINDKCNYALNLYTGTELLEYQDISMSGNRLPMQISHIYNSLYKSKNYFSVGSSKIETGLPNGWKLNVQQYLYSEGEGSEQKYVYIDQAGFRHNLYRYLKVDATPSGSSYTFNTDNYEFRDDSIGMKYIGLDKLMDNSGTVYQFSGGVLTKITDKNGNTMQFTYGNDNECNYVLKSITDGCGRRADLHYEGGCLTRISLPDSTEIEYHNIGSSVKYLDEILHSDGTSLRFMYNLDDISMISDVTGYRLNIIRNGNHYTFRDGTSVNTISGTHIEELCEVSAENEVNTTNEVWVNDGYSVVKYENGTKTYYKFDSEGVCVNKFTLSADDSPRVLAFEGARIDDNQSYRFSSLSGVENKLVYGMDHWTCPENGTQVGTGYELIGKTGAQAYMQQDVFAYDLSALRGDEGMAVAVLVRTDEYCLNPSEESEAKFELNVLLTYSDASKNKERVYRFDGRIKSEYQMGIVPVSDDELDGLVKICVKIDYSKCYNGGKDNMSLQYGLPQSALKIKSVELVRCKLNKTVSAPAFFNGSECFSAKDISRVYYGSESYVVNADTPEEMQSFANDVANMLSNPGKIYKDGEEIESGVDLATIKLSGSVSTSNSYRSFNNNLFSLDFAPRGYAETDSAAGTNRSWSDMQGMLRRSAFINPKGEEFHVFYYYDIHGNLVKVQDEKLGDKTEYAYNSHGTVIKETVGNEHSDDKLIYESQTDTSGYYTVKEYDERYSVLDGSENCEAVYTQSAYDSYKGRLNKVTLPNGQAYNYGYGDDGLLKSVSAGFATRDGNSVNHIQNENTQYEYNAGLLTKINRTGAVYEFEYDGYSRIKKVKFNGVTVYSAAYNKTSDGKSYTNVSYGNGWSGEEVSDEYGRFIEKSVTKNGAKQVLASAEYDETTMQLKSLTDSACGSGKTTELTYLYNDHGEVDAVEYSGYRTGKYIQEADNEGYVIRTVYEKGIGEKQEYRYLYKKFGSTSGNRVPNAPLTKIYLPTGKKVKYVYDALNRLGEKGIVTDEEEYFSELYSYEEGGYREYTVYNNLLKNNISPLCLGGVCGGGSTGGGGETNPPVTVIRPDRKTTFVSEVEFRGLNLTDKYEYDKNGNISKRTIGGKEIRYTYDDIDRLIREDNAALNKTYFYEYDDFGNIEKVTSYNYTTGNSLTGGVTRTYSYDSNKRLTSVTENGVTQSISGYDALGNPSSYKGKMLTWTRGRMLASSGSDSYLYDMDGVRQEKTVNGVTHAYYTDGTKILAEKVGDKVFEYYYDAQGVIGFKYDGNVYYYKKNLLGDIDRIYDANKNLVAEYKYDAWGNHRIYTSGGIDITENMSYNSSVAKLNPFRYRGYYYDAETGLYYLNSRYYDPSIGRFINADDISYIQPTDINGLNLYAYCGNNPVMYVDPEGCSVLLTLLFGFLIGFTISGVVEIGNQIDTYGWNISDWDWRQIGLSALGGGVAGLISAIPVGGMVGTFFFGGVGAVAGGIISGAVTDIQSGIKIFAVGAFANLIGYGVGKGIEKFKVGKIIKLSPKAKSAAIWKLKGVNPSSLTKEVRYVFKNYTRKQIGNVVREASKWLRYSIQSSFVSSILSSF